MTKSPVIPSPLSLDKHPQSSSFTFDVYLSFRGRDAWFGFVKRLDKELSQKGICTFFNERYSHFPVGQDISYATSKAIQNSKISIVVLSKNYAYSTRCLDELVKILECREGNDKQVVIPVFYHVYPSDVRYQKNSYGKAIAEHENRFPEKVETWKSALHEIACFDGHHVPTTSRDEVDFIEMIVEEVCAHTDPKPIFVVGLEHRIEEVKSLLDMKPNDDDTVCMLGIYGLGGVGKTELAKALYNQIVHQFDVESFLENVSESVKSNGMENLQMKLLSDMREELVIESGNTNKGMYDIKCKLGKKKVLLVLDDVDDKEQLKNLAGGCDWFGSGSRIIITTRDKNLLITHGVQKVYKMTELNYQHSRELFCWNAFGVSHYESCYELPYDIDYIRAVGYADGLPLALKVIGAELSMQESSKAWESTLKRYEKIPHEKIQEVLKKSYDKLDYNARHVFLDIACFFNGVRIEYVEKILEEFNATCSIEELVNKSLLHVEHGCLKMHGLIQRMGREIVRQEAPLNPGQRSRLWYYEDIHKVLRKDYGSDAIQGIIFDPHQREEIDWSGIAFKKMKNLRILIFRNLFFTSEPKYLPNHLRLLHWEEYPSKYFPATFNPKKIIVLNLSKSSLMLEERFKKFSLRTLYFENSGLSDEYLGTILNHFPKLEELIASKNNFVSLPGCIKESIHLTCLKVSDCHKLREIPEFANLRTLDVYGCGKLEQILELPSTIQKVDARYCFSLKGKTLTMLWSQVQKELHGLEIVMPQTEIPDWFHFRGNGGSPHFWTHRKFPIVALALVFQDVNKMAKQSRRQLVELVLVINGIHVPHKGNDNFRIAPDHVLICDLRLFFTDEEWLRLDSFLEYDWNLVQVSFVVESPMIVSCWGVFMYKQGTNMENVQFDPKYSNITNLSHSTVPTRNLEQEQSEKIDSLAADQPFDETIDVPDISNSIGSQLQESLTRETSTNLWDQVSKEIRRLEIVMPQTEIPGWFDFLGKGGNPSFWARKKFPVVALALVFQDVNRMARQSRRQLVELDLVINCKRVPRKGYYNFKIVPGHVLVCDLRILFSDKEWVGLDAFLEHDWNLVQVSYDSTMTLSCWGVFVYRKETNMEDVKFMCPDPKYSNTANNISPTTVSPTDPKQKKWKEMIESLSLEKMFEGTLIMNLEERDNFVDEDFVAEQMHDVMEILKEMSKQAEDVLEGKQLDENSILARVVDTIQKSEDEAANNAEIKLPMDVGEASTSGHQGSSGSEQEMMEIFYDGMLDGLFEAHTSFPTLGIETIMDAALIKGDGVALARSLLRVPDSEVENLESEGQGQGPQVKLKIYREGIMNGLQEAKLSFPTLDIEATLNTVLSRRAHEATHMVQQGEGLS